MAIYNNNNNNNYNNNNSNVNFFLALTQYFEYFYILNRCLTVNLVYNIPVILSFCS